MAHRHHHYLALKAIYPAAQNQLAAIYEYRFGLSHIVAQSEAQRLLDWLIRDHYDADVAD
jgi:hypothetical protein